MRAARFFAWNADRLRCQTGELSPNLLFFGCAEQNIMDSFITGQFVRG